jgi:hypothetical protein
MCCLLWHIYEMHPALSLKSGCDTLLNHYTFDHVYLFHLVQMNISYSSYANAKTNVLPSLIMYLVLD